MTSASRAIAVFDSGVGGLTVFRALRRRLPHESLVYFGDTAHVPYGTKSAETVRRLTRAHLAFLSRRRVKCAVVACNTASAVALDGAALDRTLNGHGPAVPIIGVIEPGVRMALARTRSGRIGVLGTSTTIASGAYQRRLAAAGGVRVTARACPLFVPLIEAGWADHPVARRIAAEYVAPLKAARVDTVILGCTHYPLIKPVLGRVLGRGVELVDSAEAVEMEVERILAGRGLLCRTGSGHDTFFLTDTGGTFPEIARRFLGSPIRRLVRVDTGVETVRDAVRA